MARQTYTRTKPKGPSKLVNFGLIVLIALVVTYQWNRIRDYVAELSGMYGSAPTILDADFRRVSAIGKTAVARYWVQNNRPPSSNQQAGLEEPANYKGGMITKMEVVSGGAIVVQFDRNSGVAYGTVTLVPDPTQLLENVIKWQCETASYPNLPDCKYKPLAQ